MKPRSEHDYYRPRDPLETAGAYVILLIVAIVALVPAYYPVSDADVRAQADEHPAVVAQPRDVASAASADTGAAERF
jgi:hypothetical protein